MRELVVGDELDKAALADQLRYIHDQYPQIAVVGGLGRVAIYDEYMHFGILEPEEIEPTRAIISKPSELGPGSDIDMVFTPDDFLRDPCASEPYLADTALEHSFDLDENGAVVLSGIRYDPDSPGVFEDRIRFQFVIDRELFALRTRRLRINGALVPVNTFLVGVLQQFDYLIMSPDEPDKYAQRRLQLGKFAAHLSALSPDEFPPQEALEPLLEANRIIVRTDPGFDLADWEQSAPGWRLSSQ